MEIPRTSSSLGITIVGGSDTPLRCVVVQEVFPDGLVASDGRLQPGDQIIEINGIDMTCASHAQVCQKINTSKPEYLDELIIGFKPLEYPGLHFNLEGPVKRSYYIFSDIFLH